MIYATLLFPHIYQWIYVDLICMVLYIFYIIYTLCNNIKLLYNSYINSSCLCKFVFWVFISSQVSSYSLNFLKICILWTDHMSFLVDVFIYGKTIFWYIILSSLSYAVESFINSFRPLANYYFSAPNGPLVT